MGKERTYRAEFSSTPDFSFGQRLGFTSMGINDPNVKRNLARLGKLATQGNLEAIPSNATVEQVREAQGYVPGTKKPEEGLSYHVVPVFMRVVEVMDGKEREGSEGFQLAGIDTELAAPLIA